MRRTRTAVPTSATLSACLVLAAIPALASAGPQTKSCTHINGCAISVSSPPPLPMATRGGPPEQPASQLAVAVATSPTQSGKARHRSGMLVGDAQRGRRIRCGGYRLRAPTTFQFQFQPSVASTGRHRLKIGFTYEVVERITNTTAGGIQFCLGADFGFKTLSGRPAPARRLPDGTRGHVGLLPPCPKPLPPAGPNSDPCLEFIKTVKDPNSTTGVDAILKARISTLAVAVVIGARDPGGDDPWGGG